MPNADNDYRKALLSILIRLDQLDAEAEAMLAQVADPELLAWVGEVRGLLVGLHANVTEQLAQLATE